MILKSYFFSFLLLISILLGGVFGYWFDGLTIYLKPFGDIFLNLIFTTIVPLIFFSVSAAIARAGAQGKLQKIVASMAFVFLCTGLLAAILMVFVVKLFPPALGINLKLAQAEHGATPHIFSQLVDIFTVADFSQLLTHHHMLALIVFSLLVGLATSSKTHNENSLFLEFLQAGEAVSMRVFSLIMYYAPIGFFAYFAVLVSELGPKLFESYLRVAIIYYTFALIYFLLMYSLYAYIASGRVGFKLFWQHVFLPMITSIATCSSAASIPANLAAANGMGIAKEIYETTIPLGTILHKEGSVIGGVVKIAFLFGLFHLEFSGFSVLLTAVAIALLVGTVMGAIPSGGMLGELLILNVYGFPPSALMAVAAISIIIDPLATMLNVTGNTVGSMLIARLVDGKKWCLPQASSTPSHIMIN